MKVNQLKVGSLLSYVQMIVNVIINLVYTPIMLRLLGKSEYGLYNTVASTISMLSILSLGFNSAYIKFYAKYKSEDDELSIQKLNGLFLLLFTVFAVVSIACGVFLSFHLNLVFSDGLTQNEYAIAKILMLLLTVNLGCTFPMSVFANIISAHEKFVFLKLMQMAKTILGPLVTLPLLLIGYRSIAMVSVTVGISVLVDILHLFYVKVILKQKFVFHNFEKGLLRKVFSFTYLIVIQVIVEQVNWNLDKILLGRFQGTGEVSVYAVGFSLFNYYMLVSFAVSNVFGPRIYQIVNNTQDDVQRKENLTNLLIKVGRIQYSVLMLFATGILFFGKAFIRFWAGEGYEDSYIVAIVLIFSSSIDLIQNIGIEIQRALGKQKTRTILYSVMALINLGLSIVLCQRYGAIGCVVGTAISFILGNGIFINIYYHFRCGLNMLRFWGNILKVSVGLIIPILAGVTIFYFIEISSILRLLSCIVLYLIIYCISMWFMGINNTEKELIKKPLYKLLKTKKHKKEENQ